MTEFGKTPHIPVDAFAKIGYHCVIFPVSTLRIAMKAVESFLIDLRKTGTAKD
jgi:methylisocitrate lyase